MGKLFLLLVGLVVLELTVMIEVGSVIGALPTVGLLILTAVLGSSLVRSEGIKTLFSAQQKMQMGEMPGREVMGGMMLALAGLFFLVGGGKLITLGGSWYFALAGAALLASGVQFVRQRLTAGGGRHG